MRENNRLKLLAAILLPLLAAGLVYALYALKPVTKKRRPTAVVPIVEAVAVSPGRAEIQIEASGVVVPAREVTISAEVEGPILSLSSELVPGGILPQGALLLKIDPADYLLQVKERQAELASAQSRLDLERGQQVIARDEWARFEKEYPDAQADARLALREPQLKSAEAAVAAAQNRLDAAELALGRCEIRSPFNAVVIEESAEAGQLVGRQSKIATLVGIDYFRVQASLLPEYLERIALPGRGKKGARVNVIVEGGEGSSTVRTGYVERVLTDLDPRGKMARVVIRIDDPLNLAGKEGGGKVLLGSFVRLEIEAGDMDDVFTLPREALADGDRLLVLKPDGTLDIREAKVRWRRVKEVLVSAEIAQGERLIVSRLQNPLPGMKLRTAGEKPAEKKGPPAGGEKKE